MCSCSSNLKIICSECRASDLEADTCQAVLDATPKLVALPSFVGEALSERVGWEQLVSAALAQGDDAQAGATIRSVLQQYADECIRDAIEDRKCSPSDAASSLIAIHTPAVIGAAA